MIDMLVGFWLGREMGCVPYRIWLTLRWLKSQFDGVRRTEGVMIDDV